MIKKNDRNATKKIIDLMLRKNRILLTKIETLEAEVFDLTRSKELLSVQDIRLKYGISRSTFDRYRKQGLKVIQPISNGKLFVDGTEFQRFLNKKKW